MSLIRKHVAVLQAWACLALVLGGCTQKNRWVFWVRTRVSEPCTEILHNAFVGRSSNRAIQTWLCSKSMLMKMRSALLPFVTNIHCE